MGKYAISQEGADAMQQLSSDILAAAEGVRTATETLKSSIMQYEDAFGAYRDDTLDIITQITRIMDDKAEAFSVLSREAYHQAEEIRSVMSLTGGTAGELSGQNAEIGEIDIQGEKIQRNQQYAEDVLEKLQSGLSSYTDKEMVMASGEERALNVPHEVAGDGQRRGEWKDSVFYLDDHFVPERFNEKRLTVAEIKNNLRERYGIAFDGGISFVNGAADFRTVSVAGISARDIVMREKDISAEDYDHLEPTERTKLFADVFQRKKRDDNFKNADAIAAERQLPIPGLPAEYTKEDVRKWRETNHFSWDEQVDGGYNLVPMIIHGNISHSGLVNSARRASQYIDRRKGESPEKYSWNEAEAPVSIEEFLSKGGR